MRMAPFTSTSRLRLTVWQPSPSSLRGRGSSECQKSEIGSRKVQRNGVAQAAAQYVRLFLEGDQPGEWPCAGQYTKGSAIQHSGYRIRAGGLSNSGRALVYYTLRSVEATANTARLPCV